MTPDERFERFFQSKAFAVVGAAKNRDKYGNKVLRCYMQHARRVYPVNPRSGEIEGLACIAGIKDLPDTVKSISVITPPPVTEQIVRQAVAKGIKNIWMQPGAGSPAAIADCRAADVNVIGDGSCVLVHMGFDNSWIPA
jgi:uncharacterized protein